MGVGQTIGLQNTYVPDNINWFVYATSVFVLKEH
jgi:hypothetical protein